MMCVKVAHSLGLPGCLLRLHYSLNQCISTWGALLSDLKANEAKDLCESSASPWPPKLFVKIALQPKTVHIHLGCITFRYESK